MSLLEKDFATQARERFLRPTGNEKLVIGEWERDAYADNQIDDWRRLAERHGMEVGGHPVAEQAVVVMRSRFRERIDQRYIVVKEPVSL